jgi:dTDP-4-amino-4,6-dideoxygalactose transaminase
MIKFLDLQKINSKYSEELKEAASEVIDSGWFLQGERVKKFEENLSSYLRTKHVIACANGLDALRLILRAYKEMDLLKDGDEIIVPANTYIATILAITDNNLHPVLVEPDEKTYNLDLTKIENSITVKTKAVLVVHLYGLICWSKELEDIAKKYSLLLIEDNAQAIGATWEDGRMSGSLGHAAGLSFYPGKNLGALGDSGAVATDDDEIARIVRAIGNYGSSKKYVNEYKGLNSRMDEIQAAFLSIKLKYVDNENEIRRGVADYYLKNFENRKLTLPKLTANNRDSHVWHLFVVRSNDRDNFQKYLLEKGVQTLIHYPIPPHKQQCYKEYNKMNYPLTSLLADEVVSLPISPVLSEQEIMSVVEIINQW